MNEKQCKDCRWLEVYEGKNICGYIADVYLLAISVDHEQLCKIGKYEKRTGIMAAELLSDPDEGELFKYCDKGAAMRENLKKARTKAGLTQQALADKLGIDIRYYKALESAERLGAIWIWDALEDALAVNQRVLREIPFGKAECR